MAKRKKDERTFKMVEDVVRLRKEGYTIKQIADRFNLSTRTVYTYLDEAAKNAGMTREQLLQYPRSVDISRKSKMEPMPKFDMKSFEKKMNSIMENMEAVRTDLKNFIQINEEFAKEMEGLR